MRPGIAIFLTLGFLAGCGSALDNMPRLAEIDVADGAGQADAIAAPPAEGADPVTAAVNANSTPAPDVAAAPRGGLLGFFRRQADAAATQPPEPEPEPAATPTPGPEQLPAVVDPDGEDTQPTSKPRRGLFAALLRGGGTGGSTDRTPSARKSASGPAPGAPDYEQVGPGAVVPFGKLARLCGTPVKSLGREINNYPERGKVYALIDTNPGSTALRTFFVTGFDDGCARQFSAALALFGSPEMHEFIRYGAPSATVPASETDAAYERIKSDVCRVGRGKPCGSRMKTLAKNTVFLSVYERFEGAARWKTILLYDGTVAAMDIKSQ